MLNEVPWIDKSFFVTSYLVSKLTMSLLFLRINFVLKMIVIDHLSVVATVKFLVVMCFA
jgi:hypothetical protein